ncbi:MAG: selenide, water dikinase SelD, partial [Candidatus Kapabacteria bacterium]|nr:selenide, water dikinase SelD [Candidatus Kapabacteria bacterium]
GDVIGHQVTLRGKRAQDFLNRLVHVALPRTKDFKGISADAIDEMGNYTLGMKEHTVFPETTDEELKDVFGLAVTGRVALAHLKRNTGAQEGDVLFLTKPLGIGILTTAQKKGILKDEHATLARDVMCRLNNAGATFGTLPYVHAMTDVTGFGLMGHLCELCEGADLSAEIDYNAVPIIDRDVILDYLKQKSFPGGTTRNIESYGNKLAPLTEEQKYILCDPQTSGGLLVSVDPQHAADFLDVGRECGLGELVQIGKMTARNTHVISLR